MLTALAFDIRSALRAWRRSPVVAVTTVATLGLAIGAATTLYGALRVAVLNVLPYDAPERLVQVFQRSVERPNMDRMSVAPANYLDWRTAPGFDGLAAFRHVIANWTGHGSAERLRVVRVTGDLFGVLGVDAIHGRALDRRDAAAGVGDVVVLSHGLWQRRFGGDVAAIGGTMILGGRPHTIVGVMPERFRFPIGWIAQDTDVWTALVFDPASAVDRKGTTLSVVARLAAGRTPADAQRSLDAVASRLSIAFPETNAGWGVNVMPLSDRVASGLGRLVVFLALAVGAIAAIACANVANLLIAHGVDRQPELAVRVALGAGRGAILRQMMVEGAVIAAVGGLVGALLAAWATWALAGLPLSGPMRELQHVRFDVTLIGFCAAASIVLGALASALPAWTTSRIAPRAVMADGARVTERPGQARLKTGLLVVEITMAATLLVCAAAIAASFRSHMRADPGFTADGALTFRLTLDPARYPSADHWRQASERVEADLARVPGVTAVSAAVGAPMEGGGEVFRYRIVGRPAADSGAPRLMTEVMPVGPDYFEAAGIRLTGGRGLTPADREGAPPVAVVSESFVRREFPDGHAIGALIAFEGDVNRSSTAGSTSPPVEIVGVAADTRHYAMYLSPPPTVYVPWRQDPSRTLAVVLRAAGDPMALVPSIREAIAGFDRDLPVAALRTLTEVRRANDSSFRLNATALSLLGAVAWLIAVVGVAGVSAASVARRRQEFALRRLLGASRANLAWLGTRRVAAATGAGLGLAALLAAPALRLLSVTVKSSMNLDLPASQPGLVAVVLLALGGVALAAGLLGV